MARNLVACVAERGEGPFDEAWMRATYDRFWARHGPIDRFNNTFLEPLTTPGKLLLISQYGSTARPAIRARSSAWPTRWWRTSTIPPF